MNPFSLSETHRRNFLKTLAVGSGGLLAPQWAFPQSDTPVTPPDYTGPNVIVIRFGGGVRRRETIDPQHTYSPYFLRELCPRGTLFTNMSIDSLEGVETSHGQGTLYLMTGKYDRFKDIGDKFLGQRFEAQVPTIFEYLRKSYNVPAHQAVIINGEDRTDEEFYAFSNHHLFGAHFKSTVLSLYRFKMHLIRRRLENQEGTDEQLKKLAEKLKKMEALDYRTEGHNIREPEIEQFWENWREFYGESGYVNERGDRLLTSLALRTLKELRPKMMMINYNDPDYVHWGYPMHYTRGIAIIDEGMRQIVEAVEADEAYRDNTLFVIVPDCGRDSNPFVKVPFQHHFNSKSSHEIFGLVFGPGVARGGVVDHAVDQISVAATIGGLAGIPMNETEGAALEEAFA